MNEILTPCILQTIIICISSLLALYCIASLIKSLARKKNNCETCPLENKNNCETCHEKKHLSYKLIVAFLVFLLVILFTHKFYADDNVFNFMSFASAIISIILAVLTIIYSYYTNGTTSSSVEKLGNASKKIEGTLIKVNEASQSYKESADSLKTNITSLLNTITHVDQTANKLLESQGLNNKFDKQDLKDGLNDIIVKNFIELSSPIGNVLMYACIKACDNNEALMLENIMENNTIDYCRGFLVAAKSAGLFKLKIWLDRSKGIEIIEYHPILKDRLFKFCNSMETEFYTRMIKKIDSLFE